MGKIEDQVLSSERSGIHLMRIILVDDINEPIRRHLQNSSLFGLHAYNALLYCWNELLGA